MLFTIENYFTQDQLASIMSVAITVMSLIYVYFMLIKPFSKFDWESVERQLGVPRGTYENDPDVNIELRRKLKRLNNKKKLKPCYN